MGTASDTGRRLARDTRGANLVEYLILVGLIGILALAAVRRFGRSIDDKAASHAACVESLDCGSGQDGPYALVDGNDTLAFKSMELPGATQVPLPSAPPSPEETPTPGTPTPTPGSPEPSPAPVPTPSPSPESTPTPTPDGTPTPGAATLAPASPDPSPAPVALPSPSADGTPSPAQPSTASPSPAPSPAPEPVDAALAALIADLVAAQHAEGKPTDAEAAKAIAAALLRGDTGDAARERIASYFGPLGVQGSKQAMDAIRRSDLLDTFLDTTLRATTGQKVDPRVRLAVEAMMRSGRLDVYAETLASRPISLYDPKDPRFADTGGNHHFNPGRPGSGALWWKVNPVEKGVYFNESVLDEKFAGAVPGQASHGNAVDDLANTMAHEVYHAYHDAHGGPDGAVNEAMGIAAFNYAYRDGDYDLAEMIYGTKNFYRDNMVPPNPSYPLTAGTGDAELTDFMAQIASRDSSGAAYADQARLTAEYVEHWKGLERNEGDWASKAAQASAEMKANRP